MPATITPLQKPKQASRNLTQEIEFAPCEDYSCSLARNYVRLIGYYRTEKGTSKYAKQRR